MKVFIMGMHRSGTSLVTGLLHHCGLYLGKPLLMTAKDNPKGHWEHRKFININNQLLIQNGGHWRKPPFGMDWGNLKPAMKLFLKDFPSDRICGFKDPRICFTFPLWYHLIQPEPIRVILVERPWAEIAKSLKARNGIPIPQGLKLADRYHRAAFANITGRMGVRHFVTDFHAYFSNWEAELESVLEFVNLKMPEDKTWIQKFITPSLWRNRT